MGANLSKALCEPSRSAWFSQSKRVAAKLFGNKEMRLLMLGLDAAGKTSE